MSRSHAWVLWFFSWSLTNFIKISMGNVLLSLLIKSKTNPPSTHWIKTDITVWYLEIFSIVHFILCSFMNTRNNWGYDFTFCKLTQVKWTPNVRRLECKLMMYCVHDVREAFSSFEDFLTLIYTSDANNCNVSCLSSWLMSSGWICVCRMSRNDVCANSTLYECTLKIYFYLQSK